MADEDMLTLLAMILPGWASAERDNITDTWCDEHPSPEWGDPPDPLAAEVITAVLSKLRKSGENWQGFWHHGMSNAETADFLQRLWLNGQETSRACACGCGRPVMSPRPEARYATGACRVRAHRRSAA